MSGVTGKVCCIGQGIMDYVILEPSPDGALEIGKCNELELNNLDALLETFPESSHIYHDIGGAVTNTSINMSYMGLKNYLSLSIGEKNLGFFNGKLSSLSNVKPLLQTHKNTGKVITFVPQYKDCDFGSYTNAFGYGDANKTVLDRELKNAITDSVLLYTSFYSFYGEGFDNYEKILHDAKRKSKVIAIDAGGCKNFDEREKLHYVVKNYADILFMNEAEFKVLDRGNEIGHILDNVGIVVMKMGKKGSLIYHGNDSVFVPTQKVSVINSIGAGDAYSAGFIYGLLSGHSLYDSGIMGTKVSLEVIKSKNLRLDSDLSLTF